MTDWSTVPIPGSYDDLFQHYGDPFTDPVAFEHTYIVHTPHALGNGFQVTIASHVAIAPHIHNIWANLIANGNLGFVHSYDGCFVIRNIRGGHSKSLHSWGLAIDLNAAEFPLGSTASQQAALLAAFRAEGFFWGGDFHHRKDPMHFQYTKPHTI